jgi:hypothetical protein
VPQAVQAERAQLLKLGAIAPQSPLIHEPKGRMIREP